MTNQSNLEGLRAQIASLQPVKPVGRVSRVRAGVVEVSGLGGHARLGDWLKINCAGKQHIMAEVIQLAGETLVALPDDPLDGIALQDRAVLLGGGRIAPADSWRGRIIDPNGNPLDGKPLLHGPFQRYLRSPPPDAAVRRPLGSRLNTGLAVTDTFLPIVQGQRIGLFAGSGVGKSSLTGALAGHLAAEVVVIAMIGERGREVRQFVDDMLGPEVLQRSVIVAATSDQSPLKRRRCAWTAMAVAEHFRDQGHSVLFLADSITRFAEAHREVAVAGGEAPVLRGFPPSTNHMITALCERAGTGSSEQGDITAVFSVLVAGSDMDEPIADILRGVLDGHIVLDRDIAERGRYPAVNVLKSVSRSLPGAASEPENALLKEARRLLGLYEQNAVMIRAGLYTEGTDPNLDLAVALWPELDQFIGQAAAGDTAHSFQQLRVIMRRAGVDLAMKTNRQN